MVRQPSRQPTFYRRLMARCALVLALGAGLVVAQAQDEVWRCGQTLTNQAPADGATPHPCTRISLPDASAVPGTRGKSPAPGQGAASPTAGRERTGAVQVAADEQRQRDGQARSLLLAEKQRLQAQLQVARRSGDTAQVALAEADLASIERELTRLP
jgi:hypothetical protein